MMRAIRTWSITHHHHGGSRLYNTEPMSLLERVRRISICLPTRHIVAINNNPNGHISGVLSCRCRVRLSTIANIYHNNIHRRQFPLLGRSGRIMDKYTKTNNNTSHALLFNSYRHKIIWPNLAIVSRAFGTTNNDGNICTTNNLNHINGWKYDYRSYRRFTSSSSSSLNNSSARPTPTNENNDNNTSDTSNDTKKKTAVPKEYIDAIKSEVYDMESSPPPPPPPPSSSQQHDETTFTTAKKTQDDFADYLKGDELMLDGDTGLFVKRQNFGKNELNRKLNAYTASTSSSKNTTSKVDNQTTKQQSSDQSTSIVNDSGSNHDERNRSETSTNQADATQSLPQHPVYHYKFSPTDSALSDPKSHLDRRRAIEQKLQDQQTESRATTMKNVQRALGGNFIIAAAKLAAAMSSGSSAMLSEFVHSVVDCGNQALLLVGLKSSQSAPDRTHPYGYGKAIYFWALVSALGTFFLGAGVSMTHAVGELMNPSMTVEVPNEVWGVLIMSFAVDGYVFGKTVQGIKGSMRIEGNKGMSFWTYATTKVRDPATLAVLLEDGAACLGVVLAIGGIGMAQYTMNPVFDGMAGVCISGLLAAMGMALANVNHRFLIGQGLDKATREDIEKIILSRRSIDNVYSVQSQWTGPDT